MIKVEPEQKKNDVLRKGHALGVFMGGADAPAARVVSGIIGSAAVVVLGLPSAMAAKGIVVAAGGVGVPGKVRSYKEIYRVDNLLFLKRK